MQCTHTHTQTTVGFLDLWGERKTRERESGDVPYRFYNGKNRLQRLSFVRRRFRNSKTN